MVYSRGGENNNEKQKTNPYLHQGNYWFSVFCPESRANTAGYTSDTEQTMVFQFFCVQKHFPLFHTQFQRSLYGIFPSPFPCAELDPCPSSASSIHFKPPTEIIFCQLHKQETNFSNIFFWSQLPLKCAFLLQSLP